ncbi:hypothetical protein AB0M44_08220 [Streptosporangium subroseum]|uniref:hypothetical protein n=1 Tax=Streptosporangium subroseum TaxID=106412 RepID=UPI00342F0D52
MSEDAIVIAHVFDGVDAVSGESFFTPDHPRLDGAERDRLAAYLNAGRMIVEEPVGELDRVDPSRGEVVPRSARTDGRWIWSDAVTYYLETYGLRPDHGLCLHIAGAGYRCPEVGDAAADRALHALRPAPAPAFTIVTDPGTRPPIVLETSEGKLSVAADLTAEEFAILDQMRREVVDRG